MSAVTTAVRRLHTKWWELVPLVIATAMSVRSYRDDTGVLQPDTAVFMRAASTWPRGSVFGGLREPGWPTLLALPTTVFDAETVARVAGVVAFVVLVLVTQLVARRFWGRGWGVAAAVVIGASPFLAYHAVQGLREEAAAAGVLAFGLLVVRGPTTRRDWIVLGGIAGILGMLRWDTVILTLPVLVLAAVLARIDWRTAALSAALFVVIVAPFLVGNTVKYGEPLYYPSKLSAIYYRNQEFHGQPGYVSDAAWRKNNFSGEQDGWYDYLFVDHDIDEIARRAVEGPVDSALGVTHQVFFFPSSPPPPVAIPTLADARSPTTLIPWLTILLGAFGAVVMVRRGRWPFAALLGLAVVEHFPIVQIRGYGYRLEIVVFPLLLLAALEGAHWIVDRARTRTVVA